MSRSLFIKFIAFVLAACSVVAAVASLFGVGLLVYHNLYGSTLEAQQHDRLWLRGRSIATYCVRLYAAEYLGKCPESVLDALYGDYTSATDYEDLWSGSVQGNGNVLKSYGQTPSGAIQMEYSVTTTYPIIMRAETIQPRSREATQETVVGSVDTTLITVWEDGERVEYTLYYWESPEYTVVLELHPDLLEGTDWELMSAIYPYRYGLIAVAVASLLIFAMCLVYLCWAAGRSPRDMELRPGGLNRLPLDLYAVIATGGITLCAIVGIELAAWALDDSINWGGLIPLAFIVAAACILLQGFIFALAAQLKMRKGYWWRRSLCGRCLRGIGRGLRWALRRLMLLVGLLPVIWQWLLTAALMAVSAFVTFLLASTRSGGYTLLFVLCVIGCVSIVLYGAYAFGTLLLGVKRMNEGMLTYQIPTKYLVGSFRDFAQQLNALSETAVVAAKNQLKSERMKTELITNVSHDIKTPLTSIINYVDLLKKSHTADEETQYMEVLTRQSQRLKKLIDDLMEMSKATTGNLTVEITRLDAAESVNQALGEFADKLASAGVTPVFAQPEHPVPMLADGRLVWRVLSNLLSNAVKYALPGTRLYIDTAMVDDRVLISLKNISREPLNISSEELMERFVRGDASRNTEGSGLGLNIAKSLMEVQRGQLQLLVDGDLFKVTLLFPAALSE